LPEHTENSVSVLLVKPDGVADPDKVQYIADSLDASPLSVIQRHRMTLTAADVEDLWPKFSSPEHAFTRRMLALYMSSGPSEVLVIEGPDVVVGCRAVRARVRRKFGDAAFENALHTPTDADEVASNVAFLTTGRESFVRYVDHSAGAGRFGRLGRMTEHEVAALAEQLWAVRVRDGWEALRLPPAPGRPVGLYLLPGSDNSIDYEISAIADVFPDEEIGWCAARLLEAEKFGSSGLPAPTGGAAVAVERLARFEVRVSTSAGG
jgi:nucleoside diphosphate kinase